MKRIIVCADGTWNLRDQVDKESGKRRPTNVTKLARAVLPRAKDGTDQVVFYHDGVGTQGGMDKLTGGAFGAGIEDNIRTLYRFIAYTYVPGDELYLFGFSRGAFTVRSLVGFLGLVGLLQKDDDYYLPELYACYERGQRPGSAAWTKAFHNVKDHQPAPPIRMVGVWDTVGALGAPGLLGQMFNGNKYQYHAIGLTPEVANAYQALSIDERRKAFLPSLWQRPAGWAGDLIQAWFSGVHSNVGGGYRPDGLANEALHWMIEQAETLGLEFDPGYLEHFRPCFNSTLHDSMSTAYKVMGRVQRAIGESLTHGECIHQSALDRLGLASCNYAPASLPHAMATRLPVVNTRRIARGVPC